MSDLTEVYTFKDDVGKNLYRKKTYYTLVIEQDVLAKDKDEADAKFSDYGGINHSKITKDITDANEGIETYMVDANYTDSDTAKYMGKVKYDVENYHQTFEDAKENGDIHIDTWADENEPLQTKEMYEPKMTVDEAVQVGQNLKKEKEESDVDVALNLEAESAIGK